MLFTNNSKEVIMEQESWELMIKRIYKQAAFVIILLSMISLFFTEWRVSLSIMIGGLVGAGNLRGIVWGVTSLLGTEKSQTKMMALGMFRLLVIFSILIILAILKIINAYGFLIGFTAVFSIIVKEGFHASKNQQKAGG